MIESKTYLHGTSQNLKYRERIKFEIHTVLVIQVITWTKQMLKDINIFKRKNKRLLVCKIISNFKNILFNEWK